MTIKEKLADLETQVNITYDQYLELHKELSNFAGKEVDENNINDINKVLASIQETFTELYPFYHFVSYRYPQACQVTQYYNEFIENLKKNGAKPSNG